MTKEFATVLIFLLSCGVVFILAIRIVKLEEDVKDLYRENKSIKDSIRRLPK